MIENITNKFLGPTTEELAHGKEFRISPKQLEWDD